MNINFVGLNFLFLALHAAKIRSPYGAPLDRNHAYLYAGKFVTLPEFLEFAKAKSVHGIMIGIEVSEFLNLEI